MGFICACMLRVTLQSSPPTKIYGNNGWLYYLPLGSRMLFFCCYHTTELPFNVVRSESKLFPGTVKEFQGFSNWSRQSAYSYQGKRDMKY